MRNSPPLAKVRARQITRFLIWTLIFAAAYAQSPLYTSNQNQYFLHGMARAGYGFLSHDWLANTLDPTPVFSLLVELTARFLRLEALYYLYYALLMGVYLFSLIGIVETIWKGRPIPPVPPSLVGKGGAGGIGLSRNTSLSTTRRILFLALLIAAHSAALRFILSRTLGVNWTYILEDGVADQRLLGPVFQPSVFGVLLALSIYLFLRRRSYLAVLSAVLAATLHPTYLLSAGVLTFTYLLVAYLEERRLNRPVRMGFLAAVSIVPILFYVFRSFGETALQAATQAQEILINFRIPHHALVSQWLDATVAVKLLIVASALYLLRGTRLFLILFIPALAAAALTAVQVLLDSPSLALLFPWRLSIFIVPIATTVCLAWISDRVVARLGSSTSSRVKQERFLLAASAALIFVVVLVGAVRFILDLDRKAALPERAMEGFVAGHKAPTDLYLIPVKLQDFRLASGAPAYVDFKSIPYKDEDVLEWYRRVQLADGFYKHPSCQGLAVFVSEEEITHLVMENDTQDISCPGAEEVYRDPSYKIYALH